MTHISISNQISRIAGNIASAYRGLYNKGARMPELCNSENLRSAIDSINTDDDAVRFYDYDGTLLYSYSSAEAQAMTELPEPLEHEGLTTVGWNWTLREIHDSAADNETVDVGCEYVTSDGKTRLYMKLEESMESEITTNGITVNGIEIKLSFYYQSSATVDWGDGTVETYDTTAPSITELDRTVYFVSHIYTQYPSDCIIKLCTQGALTFGAYNNYPLFRNSNAKNAVYKIELSDNAVMRNYAVTECRKLETIASRSIDIRPGTLVNCKRLKCVTCSLFNVSDWIAPLRGCTQLRAICSKKTAANENMRADLLTDCIHIQRYNNLSRQALIPTYAFSDTLISGTVNLSGCRRISSNAFFGTSVSRIIGLSECQSIENGAFEECSDLTDLEPLTECGMIAPRAFYHSVRLSGISLPFVQSIGNYAFFNCRSLTSIFIPPSAEYIGYSAFAGCKSLRYIIMQMSYSENGGIGDYAFDINDTLLEWVDLTRYSTAQSIPKLNAPFTQVFPTANAMGDPIKFYVLNEEMKTAFSSSTNWSTGADNFTVGTPPEV